MMRENLRGETTTTTTKERKVVKTDDDHHHPYLPHEVVLENILNRVSVQTAVRCGCVCKLWYKSIDNDPHFALSHFLQSQKNPRPIFCFINVLDSPIIFRNILCCLSSDDEKNLEDDDGLDGADILFLRRVGIISCSFEKELVGYCNGLACFSHMGLTFEIFNPSRPEILTIFRPPFEGHSICYGFGFDSFTKEYKVVLIFRSTSQNHEFKCLVFTLGTNSWRESTIPPPNLHQIILRTTSYSKSAIFCDGVLFWKTRSEDEPAANDNMLLSFDLHDEMFQVIQLPAECVSTTTEQQQLVHILESKGSLCVARLEKILLGNDNHEQDQNSSTSCCKVHLHFLKDKVKEVWIKETFDLPSSLSPPCFNGTTTITRIGSFSDRVLLSWYDGERLQFYDLHTKHLKVVKPCTYEGRLIVGKKNSYTLSKIDYQLNSHIQNLLSLQTFVPEGALELDNDTMRAILQQVQKTHAGFLYVFGSESTNKCYLFN